MGKFGEGASGACEASILSHRAIERHRSLRDASTVEAPRGGGFNTLTVEAPRGGGFNTLTVEAPRGRSERPTMVESAIKPCEPGEREMAAALHEILETFLEQVVEKVLEAVVHSHLFVLLLKVLDFVVEFCRMATNEDCRRAPDRVAST